MPGIEIECQNPGCPNEGIRMSYTPAAGEICTLRCACNGLLYTNAPAEDEPTPPTAPVPALDPIE